MTKFKHTLGPWHSTESAGHDLHSQSIVYSETGQDIAVVYGASRGDAALIAAAPELLAEAMQLLRNAEYADGLATVLTQDCEALEAAIAKAKGV